MKLRIKIREDVPEFGLLETWVDSSNPNCSMYMDPKYLSDQKTLQNLQVTIGTKVKSKKDIYTKYKVKGEYLQIKEVSKGDEGIVIGRIVDNYYQPEVVFIKNKKKRLPIPVSLEEIEIISYGEKDNFIADLFI